MMRRWKRRVGCLFILAIVFNIALYLIYRSVWGARGQRELAQIVAELDASDPDWSQHDGQPRTRSHRSRTHDGEIQWSPGDDPEFTGSIFRRSRVAVPRTSQHFADCRQIILPGTNELPCGSECVRLVIL